MKKLPLSTLLLSIFMGCSAPIKKNNSTDVMKKLNYNHSLSGELRHKRELKREALK